MRTITRLLALTAFLLGSAAFGQESAPPKPNDPAKDKKPSQLEEMLAEALRGNPDVRVAESKFHEAEAELNRARMLALQKVVVAQHNVEAATNGVKTAEASVRLSETKLDEAKKRYARIERAAAGSSVEDINQARSVVVQAEADMEIAKANLQAAKADVARAQAQMPYLLGKAPANAEGQDAGGANACCTRESLRPPRRPWRHGPRRTLTVSARPRGSSPTIYARRSTAP